MIIHDNEEEKTTMKDEWMITNRAFGTFSKTMKLQRRERNTRAESSHIKTLLDRETNPTNTAFQIPTPIFLSKLQFPKAYTHMRTKTDRKNIPLSPSSHWSFLGFSLSFLWFFSCFVFLVLFCCSYYYLIINEDDELLVPTLANTECLPREQVP